MEGANIVGILVLMLMLSTLAYAIWAIDGNTEKDTVARTVGVLLLIITLLYVIVAAFSQSAPSARDVYENKTELIYHVRGNDTVSYDIVYKDKQSK